MTTPREKFLEAAQAVAESNALLHIPQMITTDDALRHVDGHLVCAWAAIEAGHRTYQQILCDAICEMTDADASLVISTLMNDTPTARTVLARALKEYVAKDLVYEAEQILERMRAEEAEEPFDDPVGRDRHRLSVELSPSGILYAALAPVRR